MLRSALFLTSLLVVFSKDPPDLDTVTCSLNDYKALFRQAYLQELKSDAREDRKDLQKEFEQKRNSLTQQLEELGNRSRSRAERNRVLPGNWQILNHSASGLYYLSAGWPTLQEKNMAFFDFSLVVRIFESEWTSMPIIDTKTVISDWVVLKATGAGSQWKEVDLGSDTFLVSKTRDSKKEADDSAFTDEIWEDHTLVTNTSGLYRIQFRAFVRVRNNRNLHSLQLNLVYPIFRAHLRLVHNDTNQVLHIKELSVEPAAYFDVVDHAGMTDINVRLPSTKIVEVKWRSEAGTQEAQSEPSSSQKASHSQQGVQVEAAQATVMHDALHSIAEGVLQSTHTVKFSLDAEQALSNVEIVVHGAARVTSVVGHGMQTWQAVPSGNVSVPGEASGMVSAGNGTILRVAFKSSAISKEVIVMVTTELEFDVEKGVVVLPLLVCTGVLRQAGTLAVVKVANVEVHEHRAFGVARVEVSDVPSHVRGRSSHPIVLAYKFLSPRHTVALSVMHHEEMQTIDSVVDAALYQALVLDTQIMHSLLLRLQNTQRQYMEVQDIPLTATFWSLRVNSIPAKPVRGPNKNFLIPLLVGTGSNSNDGSSAQSSVELAWLTNHESLGANGTMSVSPPRVDMPITTLSLEVHLNDTYQANFSGTLTQVDRFSHRQPTQVNYQTGTNVVKEDFDFANYPPPQEARPKASVKTKVPKQGRRYLFEKLLVVNDAASLVMNYSIPPSEEPDGWLGRVLR